MSLKKTLYNEVRQAKTEHVDKNIRVFCMDECRLGLQPILRRVWSEQGQRPIAPVNPQYEWFYVYGAVEPMTGETFSMVWNTVNQAAMQEWLNQFSSTVLQEGELAILTLDGATFHRGNNIEFPSNVRPVYQPPYSPECNPSERLWTWIRERLANKEFESLDDFLEQLTSILLDWKNRKQEIRSMTNFYWWESAVNSFDL